MSYRLGQAVPVFAVPDDAWVEGHDAFLWHRGEVVGVRRPPSLGDNRTFVRLSFGHMREHEFMEAQLRLMAASPVDRTKLCSACFPA